MARKDDPDYEFMEFTLCERLDTRLPGMAGAQKYFQEFRRYYGSLFREMWRDLTKPGADLSYSGKNEYTKAFMKKHNLLKRTVNALWFEATGRMSSYMELKKTELEEQGIKIAALEEKIAKLSEERDQLKPSVTARQASDKDLARYRKAKKDLYYKKNRLNRLKQKYAKLDKEITNGEYHICFGTKKLFGAQYRLEENGFSSHGEWRQAFRGKRDANIFYLGSREESYGNQLFRVSAAGKDCFKAEIRKENRFCKSNKKEDQYVTVGIFRIHHLEKEFRDAVTANTATPLKASRAGCTPISYRIHFSGKKCYLQAILPVGRRPDRCVTTTDGGVIGLDFNDGFIEKAETDAHGNLAGLEHIPLKYHGQGKKGLSEMQEKVSKIGREAAQKGKSIASENLDFMKKKAKALPAKSKNGKQYNKMIHTLDYSRYGDALQSFTFRNDVCWIQVNPAYTSKIGKQKFAGRMKLTTHQAAAYTIARRAQGFKDKYISKKKAAKRKNEKQKQRKTKKAAA